MLKRFLGYYKPHRFLFVIDLVVAVLASGLAILYPFLTRDLLRVYIPDGNMQMIIRILVMMVGIYLFQTAMNYIRIKWGHILGVRIETDMRRDLFRHVQKLSFSYFDKTKTGHLMSRISHDLDLISEIAHHAPEDLLISIVVIIGAYVFMFLFNAQLSLLSLIPIPFMLLWGILFGGSMRKGFRRVRRQIADINSAVENSVQGIREVKAFANEQLEDIKFSKVNKTFKLAKERAYSIMATFHSGMNLLREFYYFIIIAGGVLLIIRGKAEVYDLLAFILYVGIILPPIDRLINFTEQLQQGAASLERFVEVMDVEPDIKDKKNAVPLCYDKGSVELDKVWFRYQSTPHWILQDVSLTLEHGQNIAIVGESGAGKSTVVSLIPRFYEADKGSILINSMNVMDLTQQSLREQIGIVQQDVFLFDSTVRENIMYGNINADEEELVRACRMANIHDFIMSLPEGFETEVGERGVKLSGGQKQRVSIARVFLKNPPILIFDEATSSLDNESEMLIQEAMVRLIKNRTTIIIAHRLSTVKNADAIFAMKDGRIIEQGSHSELLAKGGYYAALYERQKF
ncbi:MAG: ABC transporter ATP-binding protein [Spirochaetales bacterium]|nr:ABC transporter ATP-binding protein [Spirochaetales bacterium]